MTRVPEAAPVDHDGDLLEVLLEVFLVLMVSELAHALTPANCSLLSASRRAELLT